jgi:hypothetical protein
MRISATAKATGAVEALDAVQAVDTRRSGEVV